MLRTGTSEFTTVVNYFQRFPAKWENVCKSVRQYLQYSTMQKRGFIVTVDLQMNILDIKKYGLRYRTGRSNNFD